MKKIWNKIKFFIYELFFEPKEEMLCLGTIQPQFDIAKLIETLESYKDEQTLKDAFKKYDIVLGKEQNTFDNNKTTQAIKEQLWKLVFQYENYGMEAVIKVINKRIKEFKTWLDNVEEDKYEELRKQGLICPSCAKEMEYKETGLVDIVYQYFSGGPVGAGIHVSGTGHKEYQFHYKRCKNCPHWEMVEYREVPSWWDDLWGLDCPLTKGDIIAKFINNEMSTKKYESHEFKRW